MLYLFRRFFHAFVVLVTVSGLCFVLLRVAPGDFLSEMRLNPQMTSASVDALRAQYGLDRPIGVQYLRWSQSALRGDFGYSFAYNQPVASLLGTRIRNTLLLNTTALALAWMLALLLGLWAAARPGRWADRLSAIATSTLLVIPELVLALFFLTFAVRTRWFPVGGMSSLNPDTSPAPLQLRDLLWHMWLPVLTIVLGVFPLLYRHVRATVAETLASPFVRAARGYGIPRLRLLLRHVLPAAANPLISLLGISFGMLFSASLVVELIFSWPGVGPMLLESILSRDIYLIVAIVILSASLVIAGNVFADVLLYWNDPRIRMERQ